MATANSPKFNFPGPVGTKRRRMRSGGNVSTLSNNAHPMSASSYDGLGGGHGGGSGGSANNSVLHESLHEHEEEEEVTLDDADDVGEKVVQTSKCKGATTIPIFLKKTYKMIDTCDQSIASWTEEGDMFVVKDPDVFATKVIPQYFDHNKFSSFARQLNFYGFRKMQSKPIRNSDFDASAAKHVTFFNENFRRGRCDLLKKIQRSTRGSTATSGQDQGREIQGLRDQVSNLETKIQEMTVSTEERFRRLELDMLARIEQVMMAMQQQQQAQLRLQTAGTVGTTSSQLSSAVAQQQQQSQQQQQQQQQSQQQQRQPWEALQSPILRGGSVASSVASVQAAMNGGYQQQQPPQRQPMMQASSQGSNSSGRPASGGGGGGPTLPPHPKQKQFPLATGTLPGGMGAPPDRFNSLRGISALSRGLSGLSAVDRGTSVESSASAVLLRSSWEDKFFSMLMLDENGNANPAAAAAAMAAANGQQQQLGGGEQQQHGMMRHTPMGQHLMYGGGSNGHVAQQQSPPMVSESNQPYSGQRQSRKSDPNPADDLSSVSSSDIP